MSGFGWVPKREAVGITAANTTPVIQPTATEGKHKLQSQISTHWPQVFWNHELTRVKLYNNNDQSVYTHAQPTEKHYRCASRCLPLPVEWLSE